MRLRALTPSQLGAVLRGHRQTLALTQREVASKVGLLQKTVSAVEIDPSSSSIATLFKLLSALDLEMVLEPKKQVSGSPKASEW
jgi:HTH-type transcriptional regulator / antitoxin HipB